MPDPTTDRIPYATPVDVRFSPNTAHRPVPIGSVILDDQIWAPRIWLNRQRTIPAQYTLLEETGRLNNFRRVAGPYESGHVGREFNDTDVYKWIEAASWALVHASDQERAEIEGLIDAAIEIVAAAQQDDGYLNTYFALEREGQRWSNLRDLHELYCAGHLIQAAVAHARVTRKTRLLEVATRFADLICATFGSASEGKREETDGHPEIEVALIELYRTTGETRYLDQARFFIDVRGRGTIGGREYHQDATPLRQQTEMVGHAVRAVYLNAGAADLLAEERDPALRSALDAMWENMTTRRSYISGGVGSRWEGEAFGEDYELPNTRAYAESCAAIGSVMWAWRMMLLVDEDDTRWVDWIERTLLNAMLPGISLDGEQYFYQNPLEDDGDHRRQPWFGVACCPPNIARMLGMVPGMVATVTTRRAVGEELGPLHDTVWLHLLAQGTVQVELPGGGSVTLAMRSRYPWDGDIEIEVTELVDAGTFMLNVRVPGWCDGASGEVNGEALVGAETAPGQYATLNRTWQVGDTVRLRLPLRIRRMEAHPRVTEDAGRAALMRGPLLYCVEAADNERGDVRDLVLGSARDLHPGWRPDVLGGCVVVSGTAELEPVDAGWRDRLYREIGPTAPPAPRETVTLQAIPYHLWANRGRGPMTVWLRRE
ncbi:MAG TPA: beta-L-arabinofuranosidase domain-containing protein [Thermomicrobiales bacterium]|nr:beta-L-arabinofuranosidase domain-containing protein [Thermomicrobiales bacterium]